MVKRPELIDLLLKGEDPQRVLKFLEAVSEQFGAAFADSAARAPAPRTDKQGVAARGTTRHWYLDQALARASKTAGLSSKKRYTDPASYDYTVAQVGAYSIALGIVHTPYRTGHRKIRSRATYLKQLMTRNKALNPQGNLFLKDDRQLPRVVPAGSFGALLAVESSVKTPDVPLYLGFWVPKPSLKGRYWGCGLQYLIDEVRSRIHGTKRSGRKVIERKRPAIKRKKPSRA